MNEAKTTDTTPAHELAFVTHGVVVRFFVLRDATCWVSAVSLAGLMGEPVGAVCSRFAPDDLGWIASLHDGWDTSGQRISIPVITSGALDQLVSSKLADMADEFDSEVFAVFHRKVMAMRSVGAVA